MIKKYIEFINEGVYTYGCILLETPISNWNELTSMIDPEDLYKPETERFGITENPHCTVLYGLRNKVTESNIEYFLKYLEMPTIEVNGIDCFEQDEFDVVKLNVIPNSNLLKMRRTFERLPNVNKFPYSPHITIAFVKKGCGEKYKSDFKLTINPSRIEYSKSDGSKYYYEL
mgnify:CR=1 FL=1